MSRPRERLVAALALCACAGSAVGADLPDPTRPPPRQHVASPGSTTADKGEAPVLQSVLTGAGRAPSAIISGRVVETGGTTHGMRLVRVSETGAVLAGPRGNVTLTLTPGAEKRAASLAAPPVRTADAARRTPTRPSSAEQQ